MAEVTVLEAARCLSISPDTVKGRISTGELKAKELKAKKEVHGVNFTWWVEIPDELVSSPLGEDTEEEPSAPRGVGADSQAAATSVDVQAQFIAALQAQVQAQQVELEAKKPTPRRSWWARLWRL
jgi:hypothetical protein